MCSVRQRPMPFCTEGPRDRRSRFGVSALVRTPSRRHADRPSPAGVREALEQFGEPEDFRFFPTARRSTTHLLNLGRVSDPVCPSKTTSPVVHHRSTAGRPPEQDPRADLDDATWPLSSTSRATRRRRCRVCPCPAPRLPRGRSCHLGWSQMPAAATMPPMSSGLVSVHGPADTGLPLGG